MKEEDLIMARSIVAESQEGSSPGTSPQPLRRNRVQDILERRSQFR